MMMSLILPTTMDRSVLFQRARLYDLTFEIALIIHDALIACVHPLGTLLVRLNGFPGLFRILPVSVIVGRVNETP
jgi:hypothetical protein